MALAGLDLCSGELQTKLLACPKPDMGHQLSATCPRSWVKQCVPGQGVGGQAGRRVPARPKAVGGVSLLFLPFSEASAQDLWPQLLCSLLLWAKILSFKSWALKTGDGSGGLSGPRASAYQEVIRGSGIMINSHIALTEPGCCHMPGEPLHPLPAPGATVAWSPVT